MNSTADAKYRIAVIIVSWNRKELLRRCLRSLDANIQLSCTVIVVDNASADETPEMIRNHFPNVILIENDRNRGFSKAVNQGLAYLKRHDIPSDYILLLNNDAYFDNDSMAGLLAHMDRKEDVQAAIPAVFGEENRLQTGVGGYDLSLKTAFFYFSGLSILFPRLFKGFFIHQDYFYRKKIILEMDWISGVCLVLKAGVMGSISQLPEDFFMYAEDTALCREIRRIGKIIYYPKARVIHTHDSYEKTERTINPSLWISSLFQYYWQNERPGPVDVKLFLLKSVFLGGFFMRWIGYSLFPISRAKYQSQAYHFRLYCIYILRNLFVKTRQ